jgi:serine/threonine protein kinase
LEAQTTLPLIDGRFRLLQLLAVGGMGELYLALARDAEIEGLEHLVVLKRILPAFAADRTVVTMFLTEARIAARLDHPNVVRVFDMGKANGSLYFTMEYLHGGDLERLFDAAKARGGGINLGQILTIILNVCEGLHFAHEMRRVDGRPMGIVHRDVSPGNVFITFDGEVKLVDFGIAKVLSKSGATHDGMLKGKIAYMSPEQVRGDPIDRRSDIFGIGILLYEMVTLTHLFDSENEYEIMTQIAGGVIPPPSERRPGLSPELERIILKALAPTRNDRYPTAEALAWDLAEFARTHDIRLSRQGLKQAMGRLIGNHEYPWYLDDEGPEEAAAVANWFASAQPDEVVEDVEDLEVDLGDLFQDDPPEDEPYDPQYDDPYDDQPGEGDEVTRIAVRPSAPMPSAPPRAATRPPRPQLSPHAQLAVAIAAAFVLLLLTWRCLSSDDPPPPPPTTTTPEPDPTPPPAPPRPPVVAPPPEPVVAPPPEPAPPTKKRPAKKRPAKSDKRRKSP